MNGGFPGGQGKPAVSRFRTRPLPVVRAGVYRSGTAFFRVAQNRGTAHDSARRRQLLHNAVTPFTRKTMTAHNTPPPRRHAGHIAARLALAACCGFGSTAHANLALANKNGCIGCHAAATTLVGPAYQAVAARYAGDANALETVVRSIRQGGSGKWGELPMPPQAQLSEADTRRLAAWILRGAK